MNCSIPGLPVHHQLPQFTQTRIWYHQTWHHRDSPVEEGGGSQPQVQIGRAEWPTLDDLPPVLMTKHLCVCLPSLTSFTHPSSWGDCKRVYKGFGKLACLKHLRWLISSLLSKWWVLFKRCPWGHGSPLPFPMSRPQETQALLFLRQEAQMHSLGPEVFQHLKVSDVGRIKPYWYHMWHLTSGRVWDHISWANSLKFLHLCVEHEFAPTLQKLLILRAFHNSNCKPETVMLFHILLTQVLSPRGLLPASPLLWPPSLTSEGLTGPIVYSVKYSTWYYLSLYCSLMVFMHESSISILKILEGSNHILCTMLRLAGLFWLQEKWIDIQLLKTEFWVS